MSKEQDPRSETAIILERIRDNGDVIDQDIRHRRPLGLMAITANGLASGVIPAMRTGLGSPEVYLSAPVYSAGFGVLTAAAYAGIRWRDSISQRRAESDQEVVREALQEPVDIIRTGKKKSSGLLLRWHGADNTVDANRTYDMTGRLRKVAEFAETEGIKRVAIGADWLQDIVGKETGATDYGVLVTGATATKHQKSLGDLGIGIKDLQADQRVLVSSTMEAKKLVEKLETVEMQGLVKDLMLQVTDEVVSKSYQSLLKSETTPEDFKRFVHRALEREHNQHDTVSRRREWDKLTGAQRIHKVSSYKTVSGEVIHSSENWYDRESNTSQQAYGGEAHLLRAQGVQTFDELIKTVMSQNNLTDQRGVLTAVYLALRQPTATREDLSDKTSDENTTLFQRMATERLRTLRTFQKPHSGEDGPTLEYTDTLSRRGYRFIGATALLMGPFFGSLLAAPAGLYENHVKENIEQRHGLALRDAMESHDLRFLNAQGNFDMDKFEAAYKQALEQAGDSFDQKYLNVYTGITDVDKDISSYMVDKYLKILNPLTNRLDAREFAKWRATAFRAAPSENTADDGKQTIGDSPDGKAGENDPIYTIHPLAGKPADGYWYGSVYSSMTVGKEGLEYKDDSWAATPEASSDTIMSRMASWSEESIAQWKPDYLVETPYLLGDGGDVDNKKPLVLPLKQGGSIIALRIIDESDPGKTMNHVPFEVQTWTGTARLRMTDEIMKQMHDLGIEDPKLQYWVKMETDKTIHNSHMSYPADVDMEAVSRNVRDVLGLSEDASERAVLAKIRDSKVYSFTPLSDEGKNLKTHSEDDEDELREIGTTLAQLDALNCNLAQTLMLLSNKPYFHYTKEAGYPTDEYDSALSPVSGYHENGDNKLTKKESHAWLLNQFGEEVDPTPAMSDEDKKAIAPTKLEVSKPLEVPFNGIAQGTFGALMVLTAWRRREQIKRKMDATRSYYVTAGKGASEAISLIEAAQYGRPGSSVKAREMSPKQVRDSVLNNIPVGGISPETVRARLERDGIATPLSLVSRLALSSLYRNDRAIRRAASKSK